MMIVIRLAKWLPDFLSGPRGLLHLRFYERSILVNRFFEVGPSYILCQLILETTLMQVVVEKEKERVMVEREVDGGLERLSLSLPAVITYDPFSCSKTYVNCCIINIPRWSSDKQVENL